MQATMEAFAVLIYQHCLSFLSTLLGLVHTFSCCWVSVCLHSESSFLIVLLSIPLPYFHLIKQKVSIGREKHCNGSSYII